MSKDVLIDFYISALKAQTCEFKMIGVKQNDAKNTQLFQELGLIRRELGAAMCRLLNAALPTCVRHRRLFRMKYVEEVDIPGLEKCLISAANEVLNFTTISALSEYDFKLAKPSATEFLDTLVRVQSLIVSMMEAAVRSLKAVNSHSETASTDVSADNTLLKRQLSHSKGSANCLDTVSCHPISSRGLSSSILQESQNNVFAVNVTPSASGSPIQTIIVKFNVGSSIHEFPLELPPNSELSISAELYDALLDLDYAFAQFEFEFVRCLSRRMRTIQEANDLQLVTVLFSETLMWALNVRLLTVQQLADRDPSVLLALPRLAILVGCRLLPDSPIGSNRLAVGHRLPFMFNTSRSELAYLSRQLHALRLDQLCRLARWLGPRGLPNLIYTQTACTSSTNLNQSTDDSLKPSLSKKMNDIEPDASTIQQRGRNCLPPTGSSIPTNCNLPVNSLSLTYHSKFRRVWKTYLFGLHRLFKCISEVANQVASEYPTELRFILQKVFEMHDTSDEDPNTTDSPIVTNSTPIDLVSARDMTEEAELEEEFDVDIPLEDTSANGNLQKLAFLFDWYEVMNNKSGKTDLLEVFQESHKSFIRGRSVHKLLDLDEPNKMTDSASTFSDLTSMEKSPKLSSLGGTNVEVGLDALACLEDPENQELELNNCKHVDTGLKRPSPVLTPILTHRLQILNLGSALEGIQQSDERAINYLPAWQPDRISQHHVSDYHKSLSKSGSEDDESSVENEAQSTPFVVGNQCASCHRTFTLIRRRHHCRRCGHIFCAQCCNHWQAVEGLANNKPVRICSDCRDFLSPHEK